MLPKKLLILSREYIKSEPQWSNETGVLEAVWMTLKIVSSGDCDQLIHKSKDGSELARALEHMLELLTLRGKIPFSKCLQYFPLLNDLKPNQKRKALHQPDTTPKRSRLSFSPERSLRNNDTEDEYEEGEIENEDEDEGEYTEDEGVEDSQEDNDIN